MRARSSCKRGLAAASIAALVVIAACATAPSGPPKEPGPFRAADLVEIVKLDPTIHLDVRYATSNNFTGRPVYRQARAFLQRPAAEALVRVNRSLHEKGYGLLVFDGYRPWSVTKLFWDVTAPDKREKLAQYKRLLTPTFLSRADLSNGRLLFSKTCQQCHLLYGDLSSCR